MTNHSFDNGIPELTEVIALDAATDVAPPLATVATVSQPIAATATPLPFKTGVEPTALRTAADLPDEQWRRIETDVRERIAQQVMGRIDSVLEQRVRDSLADVLQVAVEGLANEIRTGLQMTLEEVITRAVAQEVAKLRNSKN